MHIKYAEKRGGYRVKERPILIHEVRDMWPETLVVGYGMKRYNPFVWLLQRAEK